MPKSKKPAGGRAQNFEPRFGANTSFQNRKRRPADATAKPGSKSPSHRGYRAEPEADAAPKRRWTAQERAGRDQARSIRSTSGRPSRESAPGRAESAPAERRGDRPDRSYSDRPRRGEFVERNDRRSFGDARPSYRGDDRPRRDDRAASQDRPAYADRRPTSTRPSAADRPARDDRPRRSDDRPSRDDRAARDDRPNRDARSYDKTARADAAPRGHRDAPDRRRDDRFGTDAGSRGIRDDRPRTSDRPDSTDRPRRDDRPAAGDRPYRDDRPRRDDRPAVGDRPYRDDRPRRDDRPAVGDRPYRDDRPRRDDRPYSTDRPRRDDRSVGSDRPARDRDDRPRRTDGPNRADWAAAPQRTAAHEQHVDVVHERLQAEAVQAGEVAQTTFGDLGLGENIVNTIVDLGAAHPFPIQAATIPPILEGRDVLARGRTGSGKTIAFGGPLVENVLRGQAGRKREFGRLPKALILAPTRELALQIDRTIQPIARSVGLFTTQIYGGVPQARQVGALKKGVDIIIGTPGRIEDLIEQRKLDLSEVSIVVLDEADHMSELGFLEPVQRILRLVADGAQKLMFSATLDREVAAIVDEFLVDPAVYEVAGEDQESSSIDHRILVIDHRDKAEILTSLVDREGKTLVFARTRAYAEMLAEQFDDAGVSAVALHGDLNQAKRTRNLERLTSGRVRVLVATDVAARGIHVDDIDLVVQADPPDEYKTYLHRSGRTGRAGRSGTVVTLITRQRRRRMNEMLDRAEIEAPFDDARPGDDVVERLRVGAAVSAA